MCHAAMGGSQFRVVMKNTKGDFKKADTEKYGMRWDYANVCTRCHMHPQSPHKDEKFDYEASKGKVHDKDKYFSEDNMDQKLEKVEDRAAEKGVSDEKPLRIEEWKVNDKGKLKFKRHPALQQRRKSPYTKRLMYVGAFQFRIKGSPFFGGSFFIWPLAEINRKNDA